ncbi:MAG TPA: M23 family metallopeptidase, partial [bacterium]|nr:M23 family metallopeptidase [bacterium]
RIISYGLHNYKNRTSGEKISFTKKGKKYIQSRSDLFLEVKTVVRYFTIKKSFEEDDPLFYSMARERLVWDWGILDKLMPGDSISFMIKGIFDKDILVYTFGILGFSVRSTRMGDFTLAAFRDTYYGDYFVTGSRMMLSPQEQFRTPIDCGRITSYFGFRKDPFNRSKKFHKGIDIIAKTDAPVRAAASGIVYYAGTKKGLGNTIVLDHGDGLKTVYGHLNRFLISSGQTVAKGEVIAGAGNSGRSTATHLHFSVLVNGKNVDPLQYTYERIWYAPFDISGEFRNISISRATYLEEAMDKKKTMTVNERLADLANTPVN